MEDWFRENAADGFNIMSFTYPKELELFVEKVIPVLQELWPEVGDGVMG